jgi:hypothetical protein
MVLSYISASTLISVIFIATVSSKSLLVSIVSSETLNKMSKFSILFSPKSMCLYNDSRLTSIFCCVLHAIWNIVFFYSYFLATPNPQAGGLPCLLSAAIWRLPSDKRISVVWQHTPNSQAGGPPLSAACSFPPYLEATFWWTRFISMTAYVSSTSTKLQGSEFTFKTLIVVYSSLQTTQRNFYLVWTWGS